MIDYNLLRVDDVTTEIKRYFFPVIFFVFVGEEKKK
jgi:hypothetical protein